MPTNVTQRSVPYFWSSANDDVIYQFDFKPYTISSVGNSGGFASITISVSFDVTPTVGDFIFISGSQYNGRYRITSVFNSTQVLINAIYNGAISGSFKLYHLRVPIFSLYKGFAPGEQYDNILFYNRVADIKPSVTFNNSLPILEINVHGLVKDIFSILPNTVANSIDFSMFNAIRLLWDGLSTVSSVLNDWTLVLNSAITNDELVYDKIAYGKFLVPINKPLISTSGISFATFILAGSDDLPVVYKYINGIKQ